MATIDRLDRDETALVDRIITENQTMIPAPTNGPGGRVVGRAQHRKHHGCVTASFVVESSVPESLQHGVFAEPGRTFRALIRFSNGRQMDDREPDAHGMAIKLLDVAGQRIDGQDWQTAQDFILIDDERFFSGDLVEYEAINRILAEGINSFLAQSPLSPLTKLIAGYRLKGLDDGAVLKRLQDFADQSPASPLKTHYWSSTPYQLGSQVVKYMAVCAQVRHDQPADRGDPGNNYLADALVGEIARDAARFDFVVHVQDNDALHPTEDPSVSWSANGALCFKLATISIPRQAVDPNSELAERIVFSPWNCLAAHEPRGKINRARKDVYATLAPTRHNNAQDQRESWSNVPLEKRPAFAPG